MATVARLAADFVGHGGTVGLLAEASMGVLFAVVVGVVWWRERRRRGGEDPPPAQMRD